MANTLNFEFYESLIDSMTKAANNFSVQLDRERTQKEQAIAAAQEMSNKLAEANATISSLQAKLDQLQSGLDAEQLKKIAQLAQKLDGLYDAIAFATATPKQVETQPATDEATGEEAPEAVEAATDESTGEEAPEETEKPKRSKSSR